MDGERKKVCFSIKRLSWRLGGIHWLFYVLFDDAFLFYELNDTQQQQKRISLLLCLPFLPSVSLSSFSRLNSLLLLIISSLLCILPSLLCLVRTNRPGCTMQYSILMAHPSYVVFDKKNKQTKKNLFLKRVIHISRSLNI